MYQHPEAIPSGRSERSSREDEPAAAPDMTSPSAITAHPAVKRRQAKERGPVLLLRVPEIPKLNAWPEPGAVQRLFWEAQRMVR